jgi:hypothetical protein
METGVPNEGHFAWKQGRSAPLWSFARTGFVLAVCTLVAIAPVPAAAEDYYPPHPSGGYGGSPLAGRGLGGGGHGYGGGGHGFGGGARGFGGGGGAAVGLGCWDWDWRSRV